MQPNLILIAGPNGAGKTTAADDLLQDAFAVDEFVNADSLARGLSRLKPEGVAIEAGRAMLERLHLLTAQRKSVAFESTLASRTFVPWIRDLTLTGYRFHLLYFWLPSAGMAVDRVNERRALGGHFVPEETIRRRYRTGLRNFFELYTPLAETWKFFDNSVKPRAVIASGGARLPETILDATLWNTIKKESRHG